MGKKAIKNQPVEEEKNGGKIVEIKVDKFADYIKEHQFLLMDVFAVWCQPCQIQGKVLEDAYEVIKNEIEGIEIIKINSDKYGKLCTTLKIDSIPTLVVWYKNTLVTLESGLLYKEDILKMVKQVKDHLDNPELSTEDIQPVKEE